MRHISLLLLTFLLTFPILNAQIWQLQANLPDSSRANATAFSQDGKGYIVGGNLSSTYLNEVWEYNPISNIWNQKNSAIFTPRNGLISFKTDSFTFCGLGWNGSNTFFDIYIYYGNTDSWSSRSSFSGFGGRNSMATGLGNKGYVGGGTIGSTTPYSDEFWEYDASSDSWSQLGNLPFGSRAAGIAFSINNKVYFGLGHDGIVDYSDLWSYDPLTNNWTQLNNLPGVPRLKPSVLVVNNKAIIGGGFELGSTSKLNDYYEFDPNTGNWNSINSFPSGARSNSVSFTINNRGYISCGNDGNNLLLNDLWKYTDTTITRVEHEYSKLEFQIYPNPIVENLKVNINLKKNDEAVLEILNNQGSQLKVFNIKESKSEFNLEGFHSGIYFYRVSTKSFTKTGKLIIN